jgi:two-component system sensor histidine kinase UhpB
MNQKPIIIKLSSDISFIEYAEKSMQGVYTTDSNGIIIYVNTAFCNIVQKKKKELLNKPFYLIYQKSEQKLIQERLKNNLGKNNIDQPFEMHHVLWNGRSVWLEHRNTLINLDNGQEITINYINDITNKKLVESELINNENRYNKFFKEISDGIFINHLTDDSLFGNFIEVNDQACKLLRYTNQEILDKNIYDIIPIRDCQRIEHIVTQLLNNQYALFEIHLVTKDKRRIPVEINSHLFEYEDRSTILSVVRDSTERSQAHQDLSKSREQLRSLASRLQNIREEERAMIAREIHDELGQLLTVLKIQISLISKKLSTNQKSIQEKLHSSIKFIDQAVDSVQKITTQLRPGILDELGLIPALEWQAQEFEKRTGIRCECTLPIDPINLQPEHLTALFRITQEALTNVARHSFAERVSIYLKTENKTLVLEITDNGKGIHESQINNPNSLGLLGIKERAMVFGGKVTINGINRRGTNLKVEWPL